MLLHACRDSDPATPMSSEVDHEPTIKNIVATETLPASCASHHSQALTAYGLVANATP